MEAYKFFYWASSTVIWLIIFVLDFAFEYSTAESQIKSFFLTAYSWIILKQYINGGKND